eukprot:TRINITY_DN65555_c0_g1_i1.p1 TRINITY_DN65555_c0_g1~~TRINITY_DN65555_c0_g1_i1.p1  ORF type:complete len:418 (+),score=43.65 TRINITY_DN65555_c0_g1_i1:52-1305(+)
MSMETICHSAAVPTSVYREALSNRWQTDGLDAEDLDWLAHNSKMYCGLADAGSPALFRRAENTSHLTSDYAPQSVPTSTDNLAIGRAVPIGLDGTQCPCTCTSHQCPSVDSPTDPTQVPSPPQSPGNLNLGSRFAPTIHAHTSPLLQPSQPALTPAAPPAVQSRKRTLPQAFTQQTAAVAGAQEQQISFSRASLFLGDGNLGRRAFDDLLQVFRHFVLPYGPEAWQLPEHLWNRFKNKWGKFFQEFMRKKLVAAPYLLNCAKIKAKAKGMREWYQFFQYIQEDGPNVRVQMSTDGLFHLTHDTPGVPVNVDQVVLQPNLIFTWFLEWIGGLKTFAPRNKGPTKKQKAAAAPTVPTMNAQTNAPQYTAPIGDSSPATTWNDYFKDDPVPAFPEDMNGYSPLGSPCTTQEPLMADCMPC